MQIKVENTKTNFSFPFPGLPLFDNLSAIRFISYSGTNYSERFGCNRADTFKSDICSVLML